MFQFKLASLNKSFVIKKNPIESFQKRTVKENPLTKVKIKTWASKQYESALEDPTKLFEVKKIVPRISLISIGNWFFPTARVSVGINLLDRIAHEYGLEWEASIKWRGWFCGNSEFALFKPRIYDITQTGKIINQIVNSSDTEGHRLVLVLPSENENLGAFGISGLDSEALKERDPLHLKEISSMSVFTIGIKPPENEHYKPVMLHKIRDGIDKTELSFFLAPIPKHQREILNKNLYGNVDRLYRTIGIIEDD